MTDDGVDVILRDHGTKLIHIIKVLREVFDLDLKGAKDLAERAPSFSLTASRLRTRPFCATS